MHTSTHAFGTEIPLYDIAADRQEQFIIKIWDIQGRMAKTIKETLVSGVSKISIDVADLKTGKYVMNVFNEQGFIKSIHYNRL